MIMLMKRYIQALIVFTLSLILPILVFEFFGWFRPNDSFYRFFVYGALLEELLKFGLALLLLRFGIKPLTIAFIGAGYGLGEQLGHFLFPTGYAGLIVPWMHIIAGIVMALLLKRAVEKNRFRDYLIAFLGPLAIHGIYNWILSILLWWYS